MNEDILLAAALSKPTATERAAFLDEVCKGDDALRQKLQARLHAHDQAGDDPAESVAKVVPTSDSPSAGVEEKAETLDSPPPAEEPGTLIGPYGFCSCWAKAAWERSMSPNKKSRSNAASPSRSSNQAWTRPVSWHALPVNARRWHSWTIPTST